MKIHFLKSICILFLGIVLLYCSFPNQYFHFGGFVFIGFIPILLLCSHLNTIRQVFLLSYVFFFCFTLTLFWMNPLAYYERYETLSMVLIIICFYMITPLILTLIPLLFYLFKRKKNHFILVTCLPLIWISIEYILNIIPFGLPISLSICLYTTPLMIQIATLTGSYGISFFILFINTLLTLLLINYKTAHLLLVSLFFTLYLLINAFILRSHSNHIKNTIFNQQSFTIIQPNLSWRNSFYSFQGNFMFKKILNDLEKMASFIHPKSKDSILIFPELTISDFNFENPLITDTMLNILTHYKGLILGARFEDQNSILSLDKFGNIQSIYKKSQFVPFFERQETNSILGTPIKIGRSNYYISAALCYETLFPKTFRHINTQNTHLIAGLSYNTWLGHSNWPIIHMAYMSLRAIENRKYAIFLNNHGPSSIFSSTGKIIASIPMGTRAGLTIHLPMM